MIDLKKYQELNRSFRNELVFHIGATSGFYSELNNMILAMVYCLQGRIRFTLYSEDANFKFKKGWNDYFLPFCEEVEGSFHHEYNLRDEDPMFVMRSFFKRTRYVLFRLMHRHTYLTHDVFLNIRSVSFQRALFSFPELGVENTDLRSAAYDIVKMIYRFQPECAHEILSMAASLQLPDAYVGFHIRGGDKITEHHSEDCTAFITKAESLSSL
ncbi:MAG: hypothetical protein RR304_02650, partial [Bacteroides sp.]